MQYLIQFNERHNESALALIGYLRGLGIDVDTTFGVRRPAEGIGHIVATLDSQRDWDAVHRYPDVTLFMPKVVADAPDPLSGCDDPDD